MAGLPVRLGRAVAHIREAHDELSTGGRIASGAATVAAICAGFLAAAFLGKGAAEGFLVASTISSPLVYFGMAKLVRNITTTRTGSDPASKITLDTHLHTIHEMEDLPEHTHALILNALYGRAQEGDGDLERALQGIATEIKRQGTKGDPAIRDFVEAKRAGYLKALQDHIQVRLQQAKENPAPYTDEEIGTILQLVLRGERQHGGGETIEALNGIALAITILPREIRRSREFGEFILGQRIGHAPDLDLTTMSPLVEDTSAMQEALRREAAELAEADEADVAPEPEAPMTPERRQELIHQLVAELGEGMEHDIVAALRGEKFALVVTQEEGRLNQIASLAQDADVKSLRMELLRRFLPAVETNAAATIEAYVEVAEKAGKSKEEIRQEISRHAKEQLAVSVTFDEIGQPNPYEFQKSNLHFLLGRLPEEELIALLPAVD